MPAVKSYGEQMYRWRDLTRDKWAKIGGLLSVWLHHINIESSTLKVRAILVVTVSLQTDPYNMSTIDRLSKKQRVLAQLIFYLLLSHLLVPSL